MEALNKLNEAVKNVIEAANDVNDETNAEIWNKAPLIIHQRFCSKLVEAMKESPHKLATEIPKAMELLAAIRILKELYPELSKI